MQIEIKSSLQQQSSEGSQTIGTDLNAAAEFPLKQKHCTTFYDGLTLDEN